MKKFLFILILALATNTLFPQIAFSNKKKKNKKAQTEKSAEKENKAQYLFIKGEGHFLLKEYSKAIAFFDEALSYSPNNEVINYKIAESYFHVGLLNKAIVHAQKALELNDKRKEYYLMLGDIYLNNKELKASAEVYEKMLSNVKDTEEYYFELGELYNELVKAEKSKKAVYANNTNKLKDIEKNIETYAAKAISAYTKAEKHFDVHEELTFKKQRLYLGLNQVDEAIKEGENLINAFPEEIRYKLNLAELIYSNNRQPQAIDYMKKVAEELPNEPTPLLMLSDFHQSMGDSKKADEYLELAFNNPKMDVDSKVKMISTYLQFTDDPEKKATALKLALNVTAAHPDKAQAHAIHADVLFLSNEKAAARDVYYKAAKLDTTKFLLWQQLVGLDLDLNQNDSLIVHTQEALAYFPESPLFWLYNGLGYQMTKQKAKAVASYEKGLTFTKEDPALESQFNAQLGDAYNDVEAYDKSDEAYGKALEYDPNNVYVLNNYSYFLSLRNEKLDEAKAMSERVVKMYPEEATYLDTYAWVLYKMKDYNGAKKYLEKALKTSDDGTVIEHYGDVLFQLGKKEAALENWIKAKVKGGTSDLIDKKINDKKLYE